MDSMDSIIVEPHTLPSNLRALMMLDLANIPMVLRPVTLPTPVGSRYQAVQSPTISIMVLGILAKNA